MREAAAVLMEWRRGGWRHRGKVVVVLLLLLMLLFETRGNGSVLPLLMPCRRKGGAMQSVACRDLGHPSIHLFDPRAMQIQMLQGGRKSAGDGQAGAPQGGDHAEGAVCMTRKEGETGGGQGREEVVTVAPHFACEGAFWPPMPGIPSSPGGPPMPPRSSGFGSGGGRGALESVLADSAGRPAAAAAACSFIAFRRAARAAASSIFPCEPLM